jgi:hypothetical protein
MGLTQLPLIFDYESYIYTTYNSDRRQGNAIPVGHTDKYQQEAFTFQRTVKVITLARQ